MTERRDNSPEKAHSTEQATNECPDDVVGASQAWLLTSALQAILALASSIVYWRNPSATIALIGADSAVQGIPEDSRGTMMKAAIVVGMVFALIICGLFAAMAKRIKKGAIGARFILSIGTVYLVFQAIAIFFANPAPTLADSPMWLRFIVGAVQIASAVAAVAGLVLASTKDATRFFEDKNPKIFNRDK